MPINKSLLAQLFFPVLEAEAVQDQLKTWNYKKNVDVTELYLARKGLTEVGDLQKFRMLKYLWLNHNKMRRLPCLTNNYHLTELYLNDNELVDITGGLSHLTSLQILLLHNNQLTKLEATVAEFKKMQFLHTLNLFHNPLAQDFGYRLYIIHHVPSLELLDRQRVNLEERRAAFNVYNPERSHVLQSVAFGRRTHTSPVPSHLTTRRSLSVGRSKFPQGNDLTYSSHGQIPFDDINDAVFMRSVQRSVMQFSSVDWSKVPSSQQRNAKKTPVDEPSLLTVQFR
ncbi:leucine-rich repeat-containing protein 72 [Protopterus annectens]|uniref:leucine-rich repeat-containing protein 72 n=1 Tax=Protopterus annectens TaxID=7888 RepID=UPI001CF9A6E8|nr:leucine-rich repeat-containing protein 72 [Protopterus annectens]